MRRREASERITTFAKDARDAIGTQTSTLSTRVSDTASSGIDTATSTIKTLNPREWVEPVIGDVKQRVEPVIEQIKGISVTAPVQGLPDQLNKAVEVGKAKVASFRGQSTTVTAN